MMLDFEVFEQIADEKQCDIAFPIKEHFLIQVIKQIIGHLHTEAGNLIFGGGTSLVCAYDELTKRFSEDADFRFVPCPKSTKSIRSEITNIIRNLDGFKLDGEPLSDSRKIEYHLIDTDNVIKKHSSLRPYIKIEVFFTDNLFYDPVLLPLQSFYDKETNSNKDDVKIDLDDGILTIVATKHEEKEDKDKNYYRKERTFGTFKRQFNVGNVNEDSIEAHFNNGVLKINFPKEEQKQSKKFIDIK